MKISRKCLEVVGSTAAIRFKEDDELWSEAFILYNAHNKEQASMRHRFSYFTVRNWIIGLEKEKKLECID